MTHKITLLQESGCLSLEAPDGARLLDVLRGAGISVPSYCGGSGSCGKCGVLVNGKEVLSCTYIVEEDITLSLHRESEEKISLSVSRAQGAPGDFYSFAVDLGTTTVAAFF